MKHTSQIEFERSEEVCPADKWELFDLANAASDTLGISYRALGVLRALLTFLPGRVVGMVPRSAVVFPSNKTLSQRLSGMPESTLRRHLSALVQAGLIDRCSSPNGKRYARRLGQGAEIAFGFDLSPLARAYAQLHNAALAAERTALRVDELRGQIDIARQDIGDPDLQDSTRRMLRRKLDVPALEALLNRLTRETAPKLSASDSENERHIHAENKTISDSDEISVWDVEDSMTELMAFFPQRSCNWIEFLRKIERVVPMLGIDLPVWHWACRRIGAVQAGLVVAYILERGSRIENPGGYLRFVAQRHPDGGIDCLWKGLLGKIVS